MIFVKGVCLVFVTVNLFGFVYFINYKFIIIITIIDYWYANLQHAMNHFLSTPGNNSHSLLIERRPIISTLQLNTENNILPAGVQIDRDHHLILPHNIPLLDLHPPKQQRRQRRRNLTLAGQRRQYIGLLAPSRAFDAHASQ